MTTTVLRVLWITLFCNLAVAIGKIALGISTGALAILADGVHSIMDGAGNVVGIVAHRYATQPPDDDHPYGHTRFETLGALLLGVFLAITAWEVLKGVLDRLSGDTPLQVNALGLGVLVATLIINILVSRYQMHQARVLNSVILQADAQNTSADVWVTSAVIISAVLVAVTGWAWLDAMMALVVVGFILRAAWQIAQQTVSVLVDTAPYTPEMLIELLPTLEKGAKVVRVRSRGTPSTTLIDVDIAVCPQTTVDETHAMTQHIRNHMNAQIDGIQEIEVHFAPHHALA